MSDNLFICKICGKEYNNMHAFTAHLGQKEKISVYDYRKRFNLLPLCPICNKPCCQDKKSRFRKTCGDKKCIQALREKTGEKLNGLPASKLGAKAAKKQWDNLTDIEKEDRLKRAENTLYKNFGVKHALQSKDIYKKVKSTCLERFGKESYSQTENFKYEHSFKYEYDSIMFDSKAEINVYKFCKENNLYVEYHPNITFEYFGADNKKHYYHPDFKIQEKLYEVKGGHFFNEKGELFMPFSRDREDIEIIDKNCLIKQQLMKENGIIILLNGETDLIER